MYVALTSFIFFTFPIRFAPPAHFFPPFTFSSSFSSSSSSSSPLSYSSSSHSSSFSISRFIYEIPNSNSYISKFCTMGKWWCSRNPGIPSIGTSGNFQGNRQTSPRISLEDFQNEHGISSFYWKKWKKKKKKKYCFLLLDLHSHLHMQEQSISP